MKKPKEENPILKDEVHVFLKANPKIKKALDSFDISEAQYIKALQSLEPQITTSTKIDINVPA
jgi:hypothetical protein